MEDIVLKIAQDQLGSKPLSIEPILGKGVVNIVYVVHMEKGTYIVRMSADAKATDMFNKEKWCMETVAKMLIPTSKTVAVGREGEWAYMIQEYIEGMNGEDVPTEHKRIWQTLGEYAKVYNALPAPEYAVNLIKKIYRIFDGDFFVARGIFSVETMMHIKTRVDEVRGWDFSPMLCHGNLHPTNTIIHPSGTIYLIDWGTASGHCVPEGELSDIYAWNASSEYVEAFVRGYGITMDTITGMMRRIQTLVLIRLLTTLRWKIERDPHWEGAEYVRTTAASINAIRDFGARIIFNKG